MTALFTQADRLLELAERVEKATGPDRELDELIAQATGWQLSEYHDICVGWDRAWLSPEGKTTGSPLRYTASLDAAMTLVPEGWVISQIDDEVEDDVHPLKIVETYVRLADGKDYRSAMSKTRPSALTAAALRARASLPDAAEGRG